MAHERIQEQISVFLDEIREGKRQDAPALAALINHTSTTQHGEVEAWWREVRYELEDGGIPAEVVREKKVFIVGVVRRAVESRQDKSHTPSRASTVEAKRSNTVLRKPVPGHEQRHTNAGYETSHSGLPFMPPTSPPPCCGTINAPDGR